MAGQQAVSIEDAGNQVIGGNEREVAHSGDDLGGGAVALSSSPLRQPKLGVCAADPMGQQSDLGRLVIDIGNHFMDDGTDETLLQSRIGCGGGPDRSKVPGERGEDGTVLLGCNTALNLYSGRRGDPWEA